MPKPARTEGPATAAFLASLSDEQRSQRELVLSLAPSEQAALPSRLRRLAADEETIAWNAAKVDRDAALAAATAKVDPDDPESDYVIADPDERAAAVAAVKDAWAARKATLKGEG
jgi:hypothetical protein